jgi:hypothetical protein
MVFSHEMETDSIGTIEPGLSFRARPPRKSNLEKTWFVDGRGDSIESPNSTYTFT